MLYLKPSSSIAYWGVNGVNAPPQTPFMFALAYFFASDFVYFIARPSTSNRRRRGGVSFAVARSGMAENRKSSFTRFFHERLHVVFDVIVHAHLFAELYP